MQADIVVLEEEEKKPGPYFIWLAGLRARFPPPCRQNNYGRTAVISSSSKQPQPNPHFCVGVSQPYTLMKQQQQQQQDNPLLSSARFRVPLL